MLLGKLMGCRPFIEVVNPRTLRMAMASAFSPVASHLAMVLARRRAHMRQGACAVLFYPRQGPRMHKLHGCGCQNQWDPILVAAPILEPIFVGIGMFTGGCGISTHGHIRVSRSKWKQATSCPVFVDPGLWKFQQCLGNQSACAVSSRLAEECLLPSATSMTNGQ